LIVWHSGEICNSNFFVKAEVKQTALLLVRRGDVVCAHCSGALTVHGCYSRHYRDEEGKRHYGWVAQGHCQACGKYPALFPDFLMPHKHYKTEVIESVIERSEAGTNFENFGGLAADISTMRRWARQFRVRAAQAVGLLLSVLAAVYARHVSSLEMRNRTLLKQLARLLLEFQLSEGGGVIGNANIILTTRNCGFL